MRASPDPSRITRAAVRGVREACEHVTPAERECRLLRPSSLWEIRAVVSEHVNASAERVRALYEDPSNWARIFPATIRGARVVRRQGDTTVIEVDHVEGRVTNILRAVSSTRIDLAEIKRRYEATFANEFIGEGDGMRYR